MLRDIDVTNICAVVARELQQHGCPAKEHGIVQCLSNPKNDMCFCTEFAIVATQRVKKELERLELYANQRPADEPNQSETRRG